MSRAFTLYDAALYFARPNKLVTCAACQAELRLNVMKAAVLLWGSDAVRDILLNAVCFCNFFLHLWFLLGLATTVTAQAMNNDCLSSIHCSFTDGFSVPSRASERQRQKLLFAPDLPWTPSNYQNFLRAPKLFLVYG